MREIQVNIPVLGRLYFILQDWLKLNIGTRLLSLSPRAKRDIQQTCEKRKEPLCALDRKAELSPGHPNTLPSRTITPLGSHLEAPNTCRISLGLLHWTKKKDGFRRAERMNPGVTHLTFAATEDIASFLKFFLLDTAVPMLTWKRRRRENSSFQREVGRRNATMKTIQKEKNAT